MKYIKTYESFRGHIPKFKIDDTVRLKIDNTNTIYIIDGYDYDVSTNIKDVCRVKEYINKDKLANKEGFYSWIKEDKLRLATPEEIEKYMIEHSVKKYNL